MWLVDGTNGSIDSLNKTDNFIVSSNDLNLNDLFFKYGIRIVNDNIQDLRSSMIPIVTGYNGNIPTQKLFNWPFHVIFKSDSEHPISANLDAIKVCLNSHDALPARSVSLFLRGHLITTFSPLLWTPLNTRLLLPLPSSSWTVISFGIPVPFRGSESLVLW